MRKAVLAMSGRVHMDLMVTRAEVELSEVFGVVEFVEELVEHGNREDIDKD